MAQLHITLTIILIICLTNIEDSKAGRTVKFLSASHRYNPKFFSNFTFFAQNDSIFVDMHVDKPLEMGFKANVEIQIRLNNSKNFQKLFSYNCDVCNIVVSSKNTIFSRWFRSLLRYGNFMQNCPVNIGHYYLNGWKLEPALIPSYLYPGNYRIKAYCYNGKYKAKKENFVAEFYVETVIAD